MPIYSFNNIAVR